MPNFLTLLADYNEQHGIRLSFSEMKKTARRIEASYRARRNAADPYSYILDYADETGEVATDNVMRCRDDYAVRRLNRTNARRRKAIRAR